MINRFEIVEIQSDFLEWLARIAGAMIGSAISIAYLLPANRQEAALRFFTGLGAGLIFGTLVGHRIAIELELQNTLTSFEITLVGSTTASLCAWWGLGILARAANRHDSQAAKKNNDKRTAPSNDQNK